MASGKTSIDDLPTGETPNITLETTPAQVPAPAQQANIAPPAAAQGSQLSQDDINKIVTGIQSASQQNLTTLPSRDIPMNTQPITQDEQVKPNFVPGQDKQDYIKNYMDEQQLYQKQIQHEKERRKQDDLYDQLETPILLTVLFFLFQLPFFQKMLYTYVPSLFVKDGTLAFSGYLAKSAAFGATYFLLTKAMKALSEA